MPYAVGIDTIEIPRVRRVLERHGERFLKRVYTPTEVAFCRGRVAELAARFAAKEAVMKALGTGIRGVPWKDIEVERRRGSAPTVKLHRKALARAQLLGIEQLALSLSHSDEFAVAFVVGESEHENTLPIKREG
ncbi:MAG: holo-ACP synthase [Chloroflexi bacterium]|nr:holo-ACP synthase [Chloroflexota bacterium]